MATIGTFTKSSDGFTGSVKTVTLNVKATIRAAEKANDKAPDFRIFAGTIEFGAAWKRTSKEERDYLSVKLDDPSFRGSDLRLARPGRGRRKLQPHLVPPQRRLTWPDQDAPLSGAGRLRLLMTPSHINSADLRSNSYS